MLQCGRELASRGYGILGDQFNRRCDRAPKLERIVSGSPIGTAAVSAWASGTRKRVAASIAARIEGFTWPLSHAAAGHEVVGGENGEE
jgi:hypothetical protein